MKYRKEIESIFVSDYDNLFAIAYKDALIFIIIKHDKEFFLAQKEDKTWKYGPN